MIKNISNLGDAALYCDFGDEINKDINSQVIKYFRSLKGRNIEGIINLTPSYNKLIVSFDLNKINFKRIQELKNIFKLYVSDTGFSEPKNGDLSKWALEGVFLLNSCLTVRSGKPGSHSNLPYQKLLEATISSLNDSQNNIVYWLLGREAQSYEKFIDSKKHFCLKTCHPSPLSAYRGFFDSKLFIKTDEYFQSKNSKGVNWAILMLDEFSIQTR